MYLISKFQLLDPDVIIVSNQIEFDFIQLIIQGS
jgi:hypothetical protein